MKGYFITGTDTEVGKTYVTCLLVKALQQQGVKVAVSKPISAGCEVEHQGKLVNEDAYKIYQALGNNQSIQDVNPLAFMPPIAPHIAAKEAGAELRIAQVLELAQNGIPTDSELVLVEGAGGWLVPLNDTQTFADLAVAFALPVILVVRMKLGCINHALLSVESIKSHGLKLAGWVANCVDGEMPYLEQNIATLESSIDAPLIARVAKGQQQLSLSIDLAH